MNDMAIDGILPGQIWWDKDRKWTGGSDYLNMIHVVLGGDRESMNEPMVWKLAEFMWCRDGYCGAPIREFHSDEVKKMYLVGNLSDIKKFND